MIRLVSFLTLITLSLCPISRAWAQGPENTGPNFNVVRQWSGTLLMQTKRDKRYRGIEEWRMFVHSDGSRTMTLSKDFLAFNALQVMTAHVDENFRPIDVYASYWAANGYRNSVRVALLGDELRAASEGPRGHANKVIKVPHEISIVTHGESMNGWYLWQGRQHTKDNVHSGIEFNLNPMPRAEGLSGGSLRPFTFQYIGKETVTVPAGTFETERYLLSNIELWVTGTDRILVKQAITDADKEYILTRLESVPAKP